MFPPLEDARKKYFTQQKSPTKGATAKATAKATPKATPEATAKPKLKAPKIL
jgi:hypothetical protein